MKVKSFRLKMLLVLLPMLAIVFCAVSMITGTRAGGVFSPPEIVESISLMREAPASGAPTDYSPIENFAFCNWQIYNASYFESDAIGSAKADLGFTKYTQDVRNSRKIKNKTVFTETVSSSAFVSNAEQTYITPDNTVLIRYSAKVHGDSVTWIDKISPMNTDTYFAKYGAVPREVTKYAVTEDSLESASLVSFGGGEYVYTFVLKPEIAGRYFRNEIATRAGSSRAADMISMKLTLTMDENWRVLKAVTDDTYNVGVPALGSLTINSVMEETFRYFDEDKELEESKIFEPFLPETGADIPDVPIETPKQPSDYLAQAFAPYLDGQPLMLEATVKALGGKHSLKAAVDISSLDIDALIDDALYIGYGGGNIYVGAGGLNGYLPTSEIGTVIDALKDVLELPDMNIDLKGQLADDVLGALFGGLEMTEHDGYVTIDFSMQLDEILSSDSELKELASKISGDVSIAIDDDGENLSLRGIDAVLDIASERVEISIVPNGALTFPDRTAFEDLSAVAGFVRPIINTVNSAAYRFELTAGIASAEFTDTVKADVYLNKDLTVSARLSLVKTGLSADILYDGTSVYLASGNLRVKLDTKDLGEVMEKLNDILAIANVGFTVPALPSIELPEINTSELLAKILNLDLGALLDHLKEFTMVSGTELRAAVEIGGMNIGVNIAHNGKTLSSLTLDEITVGGVTLGLGVDLTCLDSPAEVSPTGEYVDLNELMGFAVQVVPLINERSFSGSLTLDAFGLEIPADVKVVINKDNSVALCGTLTLLKADIAFTYVNDVIYLSSGNLKLKLATSDIATLPARLTDALKAFGVTLGSDALGGDISGLIDEVKNIESEISALGTTCIDDILNNVLNYLTLEDGVLGVGAFLGNIKLDLTLTASALPKAHVSAKINETLITADLELNGDTLDSVTPPLGSYTDVNDLVLAVESLANAAMYSSYTVGAYIDIDGFEAVCMLAFDRDFSTVGASVTIPAYGLTANVLYTDNTLYISALGMDISANADDIVALKAALAPLLPDGVRATVDTVLDIIAPLLDGKLGDVIDALPVSESVKKILGGVISGDMSGLVSAVGKGNLTDVDLSAILDKFTLSADSAGLNVSAGGADIVFTHNGMPEMLTVSADGFNATVALAEVGDEPLSLSKPENPMSLGELTKFITPIHDLVDNKCFVFGFDASLTMDGASLPISGELTVLLKESGLELQIDLDIGGTPIFLAIADGTYYVRYDETFLSATADDLDKLIALIEPYLPAFTPRLISDIKNTISENTPSLEIRDIIAMIDGGRLTEDGAFELKLTVKNINLTLTLSLDENGDYDTLSVLGSTEEENIGEIIISAGASILRTERYSDKTEEEPEEILPALSGDFTFVPAGNLIDYLGALVNTFKQDAYHVSFDNIDVYYADKTHRVTGYVEFQPTSGIPNLRLGFKVYEKLLENGGESEDNRISESELASTLRHEFDIMITDGELMQEIYLTYNGVRFKLTIEEVRYLFGNIKDALDITDREDGKEYDDERVSILDYIIPEDRERVSGEFLNDFGITQITDIARIASGLLTVVTDIANNAQDFMADPDFDYASIIDTLKSTVGTVVSLLKIDDVQTPTLGSIIGLADKLPKVSLTEGEDFDSDGSSVGTRTMTVVVNGVTFTLSRDLGRNILSHWTFDDLATKSTTTDFSLSLLPTNPEQVAEHVARPAYHDYSYDVYLSGTYKYDEMKKDFASGMYGFTLLTSDGTFTESDIVASRRYSYSWFQYKQSNSGDYVKVGSDYVKKAEFVSGANSGNYLEYNNGYVQLSSAYTTWFNLKYGMSPDAYKKSLGNPVNDLSNISNITTALLNTANRKNFHIAGNVRLTILSFINKDIPLDVYVKLIPVLQADGSVVGKPLIIINISTPSVTGLLDKSATQIYYWEGMLYFAKKDDSGNHYDKVAWSEFTAQIKDMNNLKKYLFFVLPLKGLAKSGVESAMTDDGSSGGGAMFKDFFKYYYYREGTHNIQIDLGKLAGSSMLSTADIGIGTRVFAADEGGQVHTYMDSLSFDTSMLGGVMKISLTASLDIVNEVTNYRIPTNVSNSSVTYDSSREIMYDSSAEYIEPTQLKLLDEYLNTLVYTSIV